MNTKYIAVNWPDYQYFMEHPRFKEECYYCSEDIYFVPEDLYDEVMNPPFELPEKYREKFTADFYKIKKDQKVLIMDAKTEELLVVTATTAWLGDSMPYTLSDGYLPGINCYPIAVEKESI